MFVFERLQARCEGREKNSSVPGAIMEGASSLLGKTYRGARHLYRSTLPDPEWVARATMPERIAERAGFMALPAAYLWLRRRKKMREQAQAPYYGDYALTGEQFPDYGLRY